MNNCSKCGKAVDLFEVGAICPHCGFAHWRLVFYALIAPFFVALWVAIHYWIAGDWFFSRSEGLPAWVYVLNVVSILVIIVGASAIFVASKFLFLWVAAGIQRAFRRAFPKPVPQENSAGAMAAQPPPKKSRFVLLVCTMSGIFNGALGGAFCGFLGSFLLYGGINTLVQPPIARVLVCTSAGSFVFASAAYLLLQGLFRASDESSIRYRPVLLTIAAVAALFGAVGGVIFANEGVGLREMNNKDAEVLTATCQGAMFSVAGLWLVCGSVVGAVGGYKKASGWRAAIVVVVCVVIATFVGFVFYLQHELNSAVAIRNVMVQEERKDEQMEQRYREHQNNVLQGILVPNRSISEFARDLESIDLSRCPSDFQQAFKEYIAAWADFGAHVEANSGIPAIAKAYLTGGVSLLEFWLERVPEKIQAIRNAEQKLEETVEKRAKRWDWLK